MACDGTGVLQYSAEETWSRMWWRVSLGLLVNGLLLISTGYAGKYIHTCKATTTRTLFPMAASSTLARDSPDIQAMTLTPKKPSKLGTGQKLLVS